MDLLHLRILQLLTASQAHFQIFNGADLLLQTANLLSMGVSIGGASVLSGSLLSGVATVALTLVGVATASAVAVVSRATAVVAVVTTSTSTTTSLGAAIFALLRRSQTSASVWLRFEFGLALVVIVPLASLLFALLGGVALNWLSTRNCARRSGSRLRKLGAGDSTTGTTETIGADILSAVAHNVSSTTLIFTLEVQRSSQTARTRGAISTGRLARRLDCPKIGGGGGVGGWHSRERVAWCGSLGCLRPPDNIVQFNHIFIVHESASDMPQLDTIFDTESWRRCSSHDVSAVGAPLANTGVAALNGAHLSVVLFEIVDVNLTSKVSKASHQNETARGRKGDCVARAQRKRVGCDSPIIENSGLGRHESVDDTKLARVGRPRDIMDGTFLIQRDASIERTVCAQEIEGRLAVVALTRAVDIGLGQNEDAGTALVPFQLDLVALEKRLLRDGGVELGDVENADRGRLTLRSGVKTATAWFLLPGARAKLAAPSTRSLFQTVTRSCVS
ncbi:hypothetical protein CRV24_002725 [Beauveria bassiana]|nr:hypothetical protein CRV24_002725 [Beauveria bassiana]